MSTCKGCYRDIRIPRWDEPGTVLMVIGYEDGGADDPWVGHRSTLRCDVDQAPHRMSECGEFDPPRPGFAPRPEA
jgi:hypothetical protein